MSADDQDQEDPDLLAADDALEEFDDAQAGELLAEDEADEEITLQNDSVAHFDQHRDSIFAIAQHPVHPTIIATGGSEGDEDDAPGMAYVFDTSSAPERPVFPASYNSGVGGEGQQQQQQQQQQPVTLPALFKIEGHTDSVTALAWGLPAGDVLFTGGMDGRLRAYKVDVAASPPALSLLAETQEVKEINWLAACPAAEYGNTVALGADDGSVWVYTADTSSSGADALVNLQSYFMHSDTCTAGAWTPDGKLLVTVAQDGSCYAWDVWGEAKASKIIGDNDTAVIKLTLEDQRFAVEGGLFSIAVEPKGTYVAVGGAEGAIRIVSLPSLSAGAAATSKAGAGKAKGKGAAGGKTSAGGQILAALQVQQDSVESLSFTAIAPSTTLLAAGSVDGSVAVFDATRQFATRRTIADAHDGLSVVKVEFVPGTWSLTTCGIDGVVRRWDLRGAGQKSVSGETTTATAGMVGEWRGHRGGHGDGDEGGGGVMGFVQGSAGGRIVTAGDDGLALVFDV